MAVMEEAKNKEELELIKLIKKDKIKKELENKAKDELALSPEGAKSNEELDKNEAGLLKNA